MFCFVSEELLLVLMSNIQVKNCMDCYSVSDTDISQFSVLVLVFMSMSNH